jgi:hypothetical protein
MLELAAMSPDEVQFIRLYIHTMRREYSLLRSTMELMHPSGLGVKSFTDATRLALGLAELQQDFDARLTQIQRQKNLRTVAVKTNPTVDELADLFSLSFFKLITTNENAIGTNVVKNNGWFSGKPTEWKKTLTSYKSAPKDNNKPSSLPDFLTEFLNAALKLFPFDNKTWSIHNSGLTKKIWPPTTKDLYVEDDDQDFDPFGENPFDWLFGDEED